MGPKKRLALAVFGAIGISGGVALAISNAYYPVRPQLMCVSPLDDGGMAAYFGWENEKDDVRTVPVGDDNMFLPGNADRGQPTLFPPGTPGSYPEGAFVVAFEGESVTWRLGPRDLEVTRDSPRCPTPSSAPPPTRDYAYVMPRQAPEPIPVPKPPEPKPPEPPTKAETDKPDAKKEATREAKNHIKKKGQPKPKRPRKPRKTTTQEDEPPPLVLDGLTSLSNGINIQSGEETILGDASVKATAENTNVKRVDDPSKVPTKIGDGTGGGRAAKCVAPKVKTRVKGAYPDDAPKLSRTVLVRLLLTVGIDGKVSAARVTRAAGKAFDREALKLGRRLRFSPATCDGEPIEKRIPWDVEFTPDEW
ncbi:MAG: TonB family protein [Myxococcota bacterium]|jgi:TonB family protein